MSAISPVPTIQLAGQPYSIPQLAPRQQRVVVPAIMSFTNLMANQDDFMKGMSTEQYDRLVDLVFVAVTRANPTMKKDDFLNMEITTRELLDAIPVIMQQTGIVKAVPAGESLSASAPQSSPTGTI